MRQIVSPLDGFGSPFGPQRGFNPRKLFALGEQGAFFLPDPTTCFTDTAGTTRAAVGQAVALMLDKSKGAGYSGGAFTGLGAELVTNGGFDSDTAWTKGAGWTIGSGVLSGSAVSVNVNTNQALTLVIGKTYEISYTATVVSGGVSAYFNGSAGGIVRSVSGSYKELFVASATTNFCGVVARGSAFTGTIDNISVRELPGNHATQSVLAQRPILRQSGSLYYLECDGTDDGMVTSAINFTGTDAVTVFAGVRKLSDAATGTIIELSNNPTTNNGAFTMQSGIGVAGTPGALYSAYSRGDAAFNGGMRSEFAAAAPNTSVLTALHDISADSNIIRGNGVASAASATDLGAGNFGNYALNLFRRGGASNPFNGHFYGGVILGRTATAAEITNTERFLAQKSGVSL